MPNNQDLILSLKNGSRLAFTEIFKQYSENAYLLSYKYLGNKELAEDAVQNLFLKLWNIRENIDETKPINHLIFRILRNSLLNTLRDNKNIFSLDYCVEALSIIDSKEEEPIVTPEEEAIFKKALMRLSPQRKQIFTLKISGKYSNSEIADQLNLSVNTIKFQYSQSLKLVRKYAQELAIISLLSINSFSNIL